MSDDLAARLRTARRAIYRDDSARIEFPAKPELDDPDVTRLGMQMVHLAPKDQVCFMSSELPDSVPLPYTEYVVGEYTRYFVPWQVAAHDGRSWWAFGEAYFITPEREEPHEVIESIRNADPAFHQLTVLQQATKWPVQEPSDCCCEVVTLDRDEYVTLIDRRQDNPQRELVAHWARVTFDELVGEALHAPVKLADRANDPRLETMYARYSFTESLVGEPSDQFFLFHGQLYTAPNHWPTSAVAEWATVRKGVADASSDEDPQRPLAEPWAASLAESYQTLAEHARLVHEVEQSLEDLEEVRAELLTRSQDLRGPTREGIPERVRHEVWRRDEGRCVECRNQERLEFDHVIPVSRGGSSTARNLQLLCEPCNRRKGARI